MMFYCNVGLPWFDMKSLYTYYSSLLVLRMGSTQEPFRRSRYPLRSESCPLLWQLQEFLSWKFFYLGWKPKKKKKKKTRLEFVSVQANNMLHWACGRKYLNAWPGHLQNQLCWNITKSSWTFVSFSRSSDRVVQRVYSLLDRDRGGGGDGRARALSLLLLGFFFSRATDGAQMKDKWQNTDLIVCLYWPEFLALPL